MNLHIDKDVFGDFIENIHDLTGYRMDILEKDYYVVLFLKELAEKQKHGLPAFFKGGTALYKALRTTNRFSEDIDLSVDTRNCSRSQNDKRLELATKKYSNLERDSEKSITNRSSVVSVYRYDPIVKYDEDDVLQRFGMLKIEATSFTISEPVEELTITSLLYDFATESQKKILREKYDMYPFQVKTITLERIFIDKLFAAEAYIRSSDNPHKAFDAAKHIYDLAVMENHPKIISLMKDVNQLGYLIDIRMKEEKERLDGIQNILPSEFIFLSDLDTCSYVQNAYDIMQSQYVIKSSNCINFNDACESISRIKNTLNNNPAWVGYKVEQQEKSVMGMLKKFAGEKEISDKKVKNRNDWSR